jgi:hypothetical protein
MKSMGCEVVLFRIYAKNSCRRMAADGTCGALFVALFGVNLSFVEKRLACRRRTGPIVPKRYPGGRAC